MNEYEKEEMIEEMKKFHTEIKSLEDIEQMTPAELTWAVIQEKNPIRLQRIKHRIREKNSMEHLLRIMKGIDGEE